MYLNIFLGMIFHEQNYQKYTSKFRSSLDDKC